MTDWSELERLPADLSVQRTPRFVYAVRADLAAALSAAGFDAGSSTTLHSSDLAGRNPLAEIVLGKQRFVVRRFAHGGLLRWLTGRRYWNPLRPFRELALARRLSELGIRVPEVVAARARRNVGGTWELELVSRRIEGSLDLGTLLLRSASGALSPSTERACARAFGALVARLHEFEFVHADLTLRNVLVDAVSLETGEPKLWIVDLDGSRFVHGLSMHDRVQNLSRLWRHVERMQRAGLVPRAARLCASFLQGYASSREARYQMLHRVQESYRRTSGWHAAADVLERGVGARRSEPLP